MVKVVNFILTIAVVYFIYDKYVTNNVELNSKHEWSLLMDSVENGAKPKMINGIGFMKTAIEGQDIIVISIVNDEHIYIMANSTEYPTIKMFPTGKKFNITSSQYEYIRKKIKISQDIDNLLTVSIK